MLPFQALQRDLEHSHNTNAKVTNNVINHIYAEMEKAIKIAQMQKRPKNISTKNSRQNSVNDQ